MPTTKRAACSSAFFAKENKADFDLPVIGKFEELARPSPSFAEQISHATMLLKWQIGRPSDHPPRQTERFVM
jgi:hypothetical protein